MVAASLTHEYRYGATLVRTTRTADLTLVLGLLFALLPVGIGAALGELTLGIGRRPGEPIHAPLASPLEEPAWERTPLVFGRLLPVARPEEAYITTLRTWRRSPKT